MVELARQPEMPSEPVGWLYRTVRFRAINLHRSEHRRCEREQSVAAQSDPFFTPNPSEALEGAEVELVLQRLSERNQEIVVARVWGGLSFEQIGELTRLSSSTVHRHYQASLEEMKKYLDDPQNSPPLTRNLS